MNAVLIEPVRQLRQALERAVRNIGFRVRTARDGARGLRLLLDPIAPAVIYVAEILPGCMPGGDLLTDIGNDLRLSHVPVVVRCKRSDSVLASALRQQGHLVVTAPLDPFEVALLLSGESRRRYREWHARTLEETRRLSARTRANLALSARLREDALQLLGRMKHIRLLALREA